MKFDFNEMINNGKIMKYCLKLFMFGESRYRKLICNKLIYIY